MAHPSLAELLAPVRALQADVRRKAEMRLRYEGKDTSEEVTEPGGRFHNKVGP